MNFAGLHSGERRGGLLAKSGAKVNNKNNDLQKFFRALETSPVRRRRRKRRRGKIEVNLKFFIKLIFAIFFIPFQSFTTDWVLLNCSHHFFAFLFTARDVLRKNVCKNNLQEGGNPGLAVMGGDSCSKDCGFESWLCILDGHFFTYSCCKNCNDVCLKRPKINVKRGRGWSI